LVDVRADEPAAVLLLREVQREQAMTATCVEDLADRGNGGGNRRERTASPSSREVESHPQGAGPVRAAHGPGNAVDHVRYQSRANPNAPSAKSAAAGTRTNARTRVARVASAEPHNAKTGNAASR